MYSFEHSWPGTAIWLLLMPVALILVSLIPLFFIRRRSGWLSILATVCITGLCIMALRNTRTAEGFRIAELISDPGDPGGLVETDYEVIFDRTGVLWMSQRGHFGFDDAVPRVIEKNTRLSLFRYPIDISLGPPDPTYADYHFDFWVISGISTSTNTGIPGGRKTTYVFTPLWALLMLTAMTPAWWLFSRKKRLRASRLRRGACMACGYSLQGHTEGQRCPECGSPILSLQANKTDQTSSGLRE
jgi:hypothetical protein